MAQYAGSHVHKKIVNHRAYKRGNIPEAIKCGFLEVDEDMLQDENMKDELAGSTAVIVLLKDGKIYCVRRRVMSICRNCAGHFFHQDVVICSPVLYSRVMLAIHVPLPVTMDELSSYLLTISLTLSLKLGELLQREAG